MTIPTDASAAQYTGNGVTTTFNYGGRVLEAVHMDVYLDGVLQPSLSGYSVLNVGSPTSDIQFSVAPANGVVVTLDNNPPITQQADYVEGDDFPAATHERALDKLTVIAQRLKSTITRTLRFPITDASSLTGELPNAATRALKVLGFDALGNPDVFNSDAQNVVLAQAAATEAAAQAAIATAAAAGFKLKGSVRAGTTAPLAANTYSAGVLTATSNGALAAQDGITLTINQRLLVKDEVSQLKNGIYVLTQVGTAGTPYILTRASDANTWNQLISAMVTVEEGTTLADQTYICAANQGGVLGTNAIVWTTLTVPVLDGSITYIKLAAAAIGSLADVIAGTVSKLVPAAALAPLFYSTQVRKAAAQTISTSTDTTLTFDTENFDDGNWHDNVTNPSRITVDFTGRVRVHGHLDYGTIGASQNRFHILKNGAEVAQSTFFFSSGGETGQDIIWVGACVPTDYFELKVWQNGGSFNTDAAQTLFTVERLK